MFWGVGSGSGRESSVTMVHNILHQGLVVALVLVVVVVVVVGLVVVVLVVLVVVVVVVVLVVVVVVVLVVGDPSKYQLGLGELGRGWRSERESYRAKQSLCCSCLKVQGI
ncbi:hypothetical protein Ancab_001355 [Ancistrocladus abbreviatus]